MHQIKFFSADEDSTRDLEAEINAWLRQTRARIVNIFGNIAPQTILASPQPTRIPGADAPATRRFAPSDIFIAVVYELPDDVDADAGAEILAGVRPRNQVTPRS